MQELREELFNLSVDALRSVPNGKTKEYLVANAYIAAYENGYLDVQPRNELLDYAKDMNSYLQKKAAEEINLKMKSYSKEELRLLVTFALNHRFTGFRDFTESSGEMLSHIVYDLLDIDGGGHIVYDMGSGNGSFLASVLLNSQEKGYVLKDLLGDEINVEEAHISQMVLDILNNGESHSYIRIANSLEASKLIYTKAYCFPPLGLKQIFREKGKKSQLFRGFEFTNRNTSEWIFVDQLLSGLHENGSAVAIVTGRALFNDADREYRKQLVESGLLEGIIELPNGSLSFTGIKPYVLVFSHGNKTVKLIDATEAINNKAKRFANIEVSPERVLELYRDENAPRKTIEELSVLNNLVPSTALLGIVKPKNGVYLKDIAEVFTGSQYTARNFEDMFSDEPTGYRILTSSDIENGVVNWNSLQRIDYKDTKFDKFAVRKYDVIVTSKSSKVKTVVVDIEPKEKILVTGGMIIVRPDIEKIDPTYLKIFLDSEQGQNVLKSIQKGSVIVSINAKELAGILIPLIDIEKQRNKARRYNEKLSTLYAYRLEVKKLEESLKDFYLDESEDE